MSKPGRERDSLAGVGGLPLVGLDKSITARGNMGRLNVKLVREQIAKHGGNCAAAARACGVTRPAVVLFVRRHPELAECLHDARETLVDDAESALYEAVLRGDAWAVCFALKTQGKKRGYVERQELTGADGGPVRLTATLEEFKGLPLEERIRMMRESNPSAN
jgi:hypothetical protein